MMFQPEITNAIQSIEAVVLHPDFLHIKLLGRGGEGEVHLVKNAVTGERFVQKTFKASLGVTSVEALHKLASSYQPNTFGLAQLTLVEANNDIIGLYYPFEELHSLHYRILKHYQPSAQAMLAAFCRLQSHLLADYGVVITDTVADHFLLDRQGRFHYIDYGISVKPADHPKVRDQGFLEYGLAMLLLNIYNNNLKREVRPHPGYRIREKHAYFHSQRLQTLAGQQPWVAGLLPRLQASTPEDFFKPEFYTRLVEGFPTQVSFPTPVIALSKLLTAMR
jgi:serine/threonine protein kinase